MKDTTTSILPDYMTLERLCQQAPDMLHGSRKCQAFNTLKRDPELLQQVSAKLKSLGMQRFSYATNGRFAIILRSVDDQLVRISYGELHSRIRHPCILGAIQAFNFPGKQKTSLRVEILPKVKFAGPENITPPSDLDRLRTALELSNCMVGNDLVPENIGHLDDRTPIVLDPGTVIKKPFCSAPILTEGPHLKDWLTEPEKSKGPKRLWKQFKLMISKTPPSEEAKVWKQHVFHPALKTGTLTGVINAEEIRQMEAIFGKDFKPLELLREEGFYPYELGSVISQILKERQPEKNFTESLLERIEEHHNRSK